MGNILIGRLIIISTANAEIIMKVMQISISTFVNSIGNTDEIIHLDNDNDNHSNAGSSPRKTLGKNANCNFLFLIEINVK